MFSWSLPSWYKPTFPTPLDTTHQDFHYSFRFLSSWFTNEHFYVNKFLNISKTCHPDNNAYLGEREKRSSENQKVVNSTTKKKIIRKIREKPKGSQRNLTKFSQSWSTRDPSGFKYLKAPKRRGSTRKRVLGTQMIIKFSEFISLFYFISGLKLNSYICVQYFQKEKEKKEKVKSKCRNHRQSKSSILLYFIFLKKLGYEFFFRIGMVFLQNNNIKMMMKHLVWKKLMEYLEKKDFFTLIQRRNPPDN